MPMPRTEQDLQHYAPTIAKIEPGYSLSANNEISACCGGPTWYNDKEFGEYDQPWMEIPHPDANPAPDIDPATIEEWLQRMNELVQPTIPTSAPPPSAPPPSALPPKKKAKKVEKPNFGHDQRQLDL